MQTVYNKGEKISFKNKDVDAIGEVIEDSAFGVKVRSQIEGEEKTLLVPHSKITQDLKIIKHIDVDNMVQLADLSAFTMLENLKNRYRNSKIYTYIGQIVITVNPYKDLLIDGPEVMQHYFNRVTTALPPHLYGLAENLYQAAIRDEFDQVVVISGESGSGKTEAFKRITQYLASVSEQDRTALSSVARRVLESTPLLESFGNATTLRNDNSSRFGKYVEIYFANSIMIGAKVTNFLLEKSRIISHAERERNYHVFYELLSSLDNHTKAKYHLKNIEDYQYLAKSGKRPFTTHSDPDGLAVLLDSWRTLSLPNAEMDLVLRVVSAILHLGNLDFNNDRDPDRSTINNPNIMDIVASQLGLDAKELSKSVTMKLTETNIESLWSPVTVAEAIVNRDSIAKHLYSELFDRLVQLINDRLAPPDPRQLGTKTSIRTIALLDIYGFENFPNNSLEQLCINYTNENLQKFFNHYVFELEQEEYSKEGISWKYIQFPDNQPIISLISEKPNGIIHICNDEASLAAGTDESFLRKCQQNHQKHPNFLNVKVAGDSSFTIVHFAGSIKYDVKGFVDKNRDKIRSELLNLLIRSTNSSVASMFQAVQAKRSTNTNAGPKLKTPMVLASFNNSLQSLLDKMKLNKPQFVRCIKPNMNKEPMVFEDGTVMDQLRYTGVLETVRIRKSGFPVRCTYEFFVRQYGFLLDRTMHRNLKNQTSFRDAVGYVLNNISALLGAEGRIRRGVDYEFGKTKLFLRNQFAVNLEALRSIAETHAARIIQNAWRCRDNTLIDRARRNAAKVIQAWYRGIRTRRNYADIVRYLSNRIPERTLPDGPDVTDEPFKPLTQYEIFQLEVPSDLAYILENREIDQSTWLHLHRIIKPTGSIRRLLTSLDSTAFYQYGRPLWGAPPLSHVLKSAGSTARLGYRLAPRDRPMFITRPSEKLAAACEAASKLILRLVFLENISLIDQFLIGSYVSQLALSQKSLHKEILIQLLSQAIDWPSNLTDLQDSDPEDEPSLFVPSRHRSPSGNKISIDNSAIREKDLNRQAYRRLWMHIAGMLTCGYLSNTLKPVIVRFIRQHAPTRSAQLCEDRVVLEPSIPRLYPPCLLEWRANYTGNNMGIKLIYPDGLSSIFHISSFTKAENLAGMALALRACATNSLEGWTLGIQRSNRLLDVPGYYYVMDLFSEQELPKEWTYLNNVNPDYVIPTYTTPSDQPREIRRTQNGAAEPRPVQPSEFRNSIRNGRKPPQLDLNKIAQSIQGIEDPRKTQQSISPPNRHDHNGDTSSTDSARRTMAQSAWYKAVRRLAQKRFAEVPRSHSEVRRASTRKERRWNTQNTETFPRSKSPGEIFQDARIGQPTYSPDAIAGRRITMALPHEMRYYAYDFPPGAIRIRKEFITPRERIKTKLILNLIFYQIVSDILDHINLRMTDTDRTTLLKLIGSRHPLRSLDDVQDTPLEIKKRVVSASLDLPVYFGRFYPVQAYDVQPNPDLRQWLVVSHHGVRLVLQKPNSSAFQIAALVNFADIQRVSCSRVNLRPRWRCGDGTESNEAMRSGGFESGGKHPLLNVNETNLLSIEHSKGTSQFYTHLADRIQEFIDQFLREYKEEMERLREAARNRAMRSSKHGYSTADSLRNSSTPDPAFRLVCSPPLLAPLLSELSTSSPSPRRPSEAANDNTNRKALSIPTRYQRLPTTPSKLSPNADNTESQFSDSELHAQSITLAPVRRPIIQTAKTGRLSATEDEPTSPALAMSIMSSDGEVTPIPWKNSEADDFAQSRPVEQTPNVDHPLLPFAQMYFAQKNNLLEQLSWQNDTTQFLPLLNHTNPTDAKAAQNTFTLVLRFTKESQSNSPAHSIFKVLVQTLLKRPWLTDEVYCQLAKQTYKNRNIRSHELTWNLWNLITIFTSPTDNLRVHLLKYIRSINDFPNVATRETADCVVRNMEIVSRYGPRKVLPSDDILESIMTGPRVHHQQILFSNKTGSLVHVDQLTLVQDVIDTLLMHLQLSADQMVKEFMLFLAPKGSPAHTYDYDILIPFQLDTYILDAPVYDPNYQVHFRKICWLNSLNTSQMPHSYLDFLFGQVVEGYLSGFWLPETWRRNHTKLVDECCQISSLVHQGMSGYGPFTTAMASSLKPNGVEVDQEVWVSKLNTIVNQIRQRSPIEARVRFLNQLESWPLFGANCFIALAESDPASILLKHHSKSNQDTIVKVMAALSRYGVDLFDYETQSSIHSFKYDEIASSRIRHKDESDGGPMGIVALTMSTGQQLVLQLQQAQTFIFILNRYQYIISSTLLDST